MKSFIVVVCLTVLVGMATSCCVPDQVSFDFSLRMNYTMIRHESSYGPRRRSEIQSLTGSGSLDFTEQKFYLTVRSESPEFMGKALLDLDKKNGKLTAYSTYMYKSPTNRTREECFAIPFKGEIGKPWQCILDDESLFTDLGGDYLLDLSPKAYGLISMMSGTCAPDRADVDYIRNSSWAFTKIGFQLEFTNVESKIVDESVFKPPCKAETSKIPPGQVPTPDDFKRMVLGPTRGPGGPVSEQSEEEASPESNESDNDGDGDGDGESDEKRRKRGCALYGIIC